MEKLDNILVVLDEDRANTHTLLDKTRLLAAASGATAHAVRVVYEGIAELSARAIDTSDRMKTFILEAEESVTEELVEDARVRLPGLETATLWNSRHWQGVLHAAEHVGADLIMKAASRRPGVAELVRTPDDWNLLRHAGVPVMLVKPQPWVDDPVVLCALDIFDEGHDELSLALLREGESLSRVLGGSLQVVVAYPLFERWVGELGGLRDYDSLKHDVEKEIRNRVLSLAREAGVDYQRLYAEEGRADMVIANLATQLDAELVVVGTRARKGLQGVLLGNTSERLIHELDTDVVTVHAPGD
ncbi:MAG: universal stress protein [Gammaproteobacteria bacterium]|jgi:universal stress protein E|nr:universal stress protein [Gammaproteobacteria bacterium]